MTEATYMDRVTQLQTSLGGVEMQEFLMASTSAKFARDVDVSDGAAVNHIRGSMRWMRMFLMLWLQTNGVQIPPEFFDDRVHTIVGYQFPDQPVK